jgi:prefoldin subunit 4
LQIKKCFWTPKKSLERLDDASTDLMMASGDKVMLLVGESFFETTEDNATEYCEAEVERLQKLIETMGDEEKTIIDKQNELKKILYGRFGKSIQLEEK